VQATLTWTKRRGTASRMGSSCCRQDEERDTQIDSHDDRRASLVCKKLCGPREEDLEEAFNMQQEFNPGVSRRVNITIRIAGARGLPDMEWLSGVDRILYCVVRSASEGDVLFRTQRTMSMLDPVWNEQAEVLAPLGADRRGLFLDSLCFQVYEEDEDGNPWLLAKAFLDLFTLGTNPGGDAFMGELPLEVTGGHGDAHLAIEVRPSGSEPARRINMERSIVVDNPKIQNLGLVVDGVDGVTLFINSIRKGSPIEAHNSIVEPANRIVAGQFIVCVNGVSEPSSAMEKALKKKVSRTHLVIRKSIEFRAAVAVTNGLGVSIPKRPTGDSLLIQNVYDNGAVAIWNKANPAQAIKRDDRIVAVNGKQAKASELLKIVRATPNFSRIILTVIRAVPTASALEREFSFA